MQSVVVSKKELLEKLEANRTRHAELYKEAQEGFRQLAIEKMEENLSKAKDGGSIELYIQLQPPQDHTEEYDNIIEMVKMSVDDQIELMAHDFQQFVLDKWQWSRQVLEVNTSYAAAGKKSALPRR